MSPRTRTTILMAGLAALLFLSPLAAQAEEEGKTPATRLIEAHADSIVSIQFTATTRMTMMGDQGDSESTTEVRGVVLSDDGFVMTSSSHFEGGMVGQFARMMGQDVDIDVTPSDIKVLFGAEEEEYPARFVAKDSDLGLAFLQILDLKDRTVKPLDLSNTGSIVVGSNLLGLTRMARGFDCAPQVSRCYVTAQVERPRPMSAIAGDFGAVGMPVFTSRGAIVGVLAMQSGTEGVEAEGGPGGIMSLLSGGAEEMGLFVLPLETVLKTVVKAKVKALEAAQETSEADSE